MTTWTIAQLERNTSDGGVVVAHWRATATETVGEIRSLQALTELVALHLILLHLTLYRLSH
jgi:hypothetical protein